MTIIILRGICLLFTVLQRLFQYCVMKIIITGYICTTILMTKTIQYLLTLLLIFSFSFARGQKDPTLKPAQNHEIVHGFVPA